MRCDDWLLQCINLLMEKIVTKQHIISIESLFLFNINWMPTQRDKYVESCQNGKIKRI